MNYLSSPLPTCILPKPDGTISAADRAQLAVGYPMAGVTAAVEVAERQPSVAAVSQRLHYKYSIHTDELVITVFPVLVYVDDEVAPSNESPLKRTREKLVYNDSLVIGVDQMIMTVEDKLKFGWKRRQLIAAYDELLGIE